MAWGSAPSPDPSEQFYTDYCCQWAQAGDVFDTRRAGDDIVEHLAGVEDFQIAEATYEAARKLTP